MVRSTVSRSAMVVCTTKAVTAADRKKR